MRWIRRERAESSLSVFYDNSKKVAFLHLVRKSHPLPWMLHGISPSINMKAVLHDNELTVELGEDGLGPALKLRFEDGEYSSLFPELVMGLYDDYDEDSGVPWILPLHRFTRYSGNSGN